jgi:hypothetical protein
MGAKSRDAHGTPGGRGGDSLLPVVVPGFPDGGRNRGGTTEPIDQKIVRAGQFRYA